MNVGGSLRLEINICDSCMVELGDQNYIYFVEETVIPSIYHYKFWNRKEYLEEL